MMKNHYLAIYSYSKISKVCQDTCIFIIIYVNTDENPVAKMYEIAKEIWLVTTLGIGDLKVKSHSLTNNG